MLVAGFLFGCMGVFVKLGAAFFSNTELVFYRSFIGLIIMYAIVRQRSGSIATPHWKSHIWRGLSGTIALLLFFYCITVLPLATAVTLNLHLTAVSHRAADVCVQGALSCAADACHRAGFCRHGVTAAPTLERDQIVPGLLGLISGFFAGIAMLNVRELGRLGEPEWRTVFYFSLIASLVSGAIMLFDTIHAVTLHSFLILLGMAAAPPSHSSPSPAPTTPARRWWRAACLTARWYLPHCLGFYCGMRFCR